MHLQALEVQCFLSPSVGKLSVKLSRHYTPFWPTTAQGPRAGGGFNELNQEV